MIASAGAAAWVVVITALGSATVITISSLLTLAITFRHQRKEREKDREQEERRRESDRAREDLLALRLEQRDAYATFLAAVDDFTMTATRFRFMKVAGLAMADSGTPVVSRSAVDEASFAAGRSVTLVEGRIVRILLVGSGGAASAAQRVLLAARAVLQSENSRSAEEARTAIGAASGGLDEPTVKALMAATEEVLAAFRTDLGHAEAAARVELIGGAPAFMHIDLAAWRQ